jgi:hypothetical protein
MPETLPLTDRVWKRLLNIDTYKQRTERKEVQTTKRTPSTFNNRKDAHTAQNLGLLSSKWHQLMLLLRTHLKVLLVEVKSRRLHHLNTLDHLFLQTLLE